MSIQHIIWDWNGTLWDDTKLCVEINNHMLARRGLPAITAAIYRDQLCFPVTHYYRAIGFDYESDSYEELAAEFIGEYERRRFDFPLHVQARELIEQLHAAGITQAVLSAYEQSALLETARHFQLTRYFDDIIGLNDIYAHGKVQNGQQYIARLQIAPEHILFVGDTTHDFDVAQAMQVPCVLVAHGHNSRERLAACGVPVFESMAELRTHVFGQIGQSNL